VFSERGVEYKKILYFGEKLLELGVVRGVLEMVDELLKSGKSMG
jgi:hypothetical protein